MIAPPTRAAALLTLALVASTACTPDAGPTAAAASHTAAEDADCAALAAHYRPQAESQARMSPVRFNPVALQTPLPTTADIAAVDGTRLLTFGSGAEGLRIFDTRGGRLTPLGSLQLPGQTSRLVMLPGHRALVVGDDVTWESTPHGEVPRSSAVMSVIDLTDASKPRIQHIERVEGTALSATAHDGVGRVVLTYSPRIVDRVAGPDETDAQVLHRNMAAADAARGADYLPQRTVTDGHVTATGPLLGCADLARPTAPHGTGITAVLTIDPDRSGPAPVQGIADQGDLALDAGDRVYVTAFDTSVPHARDRGDTTVYDLDSTSARDVRYLAFGTVPGHVPGAGALSARNGVLRVVLGMSRRHGVPRGEVIDRRGIAVLREDGGTLRLLGSSIGAGHKDWIETVAWVGDDVVIEAPGGIHYIYDASDPAAPRLAAGVKLPGHVGFVQTSAQSPAFAVGPGEGNTGNKTSPRLSYLDLTDPTHPRLTNAVSLGRGGAGVDYTPESFGWLPELHLVAVPIRTSKPVGPPQCPLLRNGQPSCSQDIDQAVLVRVGADRHLHVLGRVGLGDYPRRFLQIGNLVVATTDSTVVLFDPRKVTVLDRVKGQPHKG